MPIIRSGGQERRRIWILVATNVQSLTEVKCDAAKAMLMKTKSEVMVLTEVWFQKTEVNLEIQEYHVVIGMVKGRGKKIIMWRRA